MTGNGTAQKRYNQAAHKSYVASKPKNLVPSQTYGNASTTEPYASPAWAVRAGADDHFDIRSKGFV